MCSILVVVIAVVLCLIIITISSHEARVIPLIITSKSNKILIVFFIFFLLLLIKNGAFNKRMHPKMQTPIAAKQILSKSESILLIHQAEFALLSNILLDERKKVEYPH